MVIKDKFSVFIIKLIHRIHWSGGEHGRFTNSTSVRIPSSPKYKIERRRQKIHITKRQKYSYRIVPFLPISAFHFFLTSFFHKTWPQKFEATPFPPSKAWEMGKGTRSQFHHHFMRTFYTHRSQKRKKIQSSHQSFFGFWDLHM